jgi:hypothetical protein
MIKYISVEQYLMNRTTIDALTPEQTANLNTLISKINELLERYNKPVPMNSGYRTKEDQLRINPKAPNSKHCECAAIDLGDRDNSFRYWCLMHLDYLVELGLWMEDPSHCPTWVHLQCVPPKSGKRIFIP